MKKNILIVKLILMAMLFYSCDKDKATKIIDETTPAKGNINTNPSINIDINVLLISQDDNNNLQSDIFETLDSLNLPYNNSDLSFGLSLFYSGEIDTVSYNNLTAVVYYYVNDKNGVKVWFKDNSTFVLAPSFSKTSHFIALSNLFRIDFIKNLNTENILLFLDQTAIPSDQYYSEFQTKIDVEIEPLVPENKYGKRECRKIDPACNDSGDMVGFCMYKEIQNGPPMASCRSTDCTGESVNDKLDDNTTTASLNSTVIPTMYSIRDNVLLNNETFEYLIDDYYYVSMHIVSNIDLDFALDFYNLSITNFL